MKKLCIVYANCQNGLIAKYLNKSELFNQQYTIRKFPVHLLMTKGTTIPDDILQQAKLFIYQPVKDTHGKRSSKYLLDKLPADCHRISFPSLYFKGYFPQYCKNPENRILESHYPYGLIPHGDTNVVSMLEKGLNKTEIINKLSNSNFYSREYLWSVLEDTINVLAQRESNLDVKVSEFIRNNFQSHHLFYTQNHPTDILGMYAVNQMLENIELPQLGNPLSITNTLRGHLDNFQIPIYPSAIKHLKLAFVNEESVYGHGSFCTNQMTFTRYLAEYIDLHLDTDKSGYQNYFQAITLAKEGKLSESNAEFNKAISVQPNNATYYGELGKLLFKRKDFNKAETAYRQAINLSPYWEDFYKSLGNILVKKNDFSSAISVYQQAITFAPDDAELYCFLGNSLVKQNKFHQAEAYYIKAIKLDPSKAYYYRSLGDCLDKRGKFDLAVKNYRKAVELAPSVAYFYSRLGSALAKQKELEDAITYCKKSIEIDKNNPNFYRALGNAQLQNNDIDEAFSSYQQAIRLNPNLMNSIFNLISEVIQKKSIEKKLSIPELATSAT